MKCPHCKAEGRIDSDGYCSNCSKVVTVAEVQIVPPEPPMLPIGIEPKNAHRKEER